MAEFLSGDIGGVPKKWVAGGGAVAGLVIIVVWYRDKKNAAANTNTNTTVTDPAGNVCAALNPTSGYCPGSPQDNAYQQGQYAMTPVGQNAASYVGGQIIGYDQNGNPIYSSGPSIPGPGSFTSNAQWAQASETYLTQLEPNADPATIATAIGLYIEGKPVTAAQAQIIDQAIAFEGIPPVGGANGDPPGVITNSSSIATGAPTQAPGLSVTGYKGSANFGCSAISGATGYTWSISGAESKTVNTSGNHLENEALKKGSYTAKVRATNASGSGPWSTSKPFKVS